MKGYQSRTWYALMGPANLPQSVVIRLNAAVAESLSASDVRTQLQDMGYEPESNSPQAMNALFRDDIVTSGKVIKASGAKVEWARAGIPPPPLPASSLGRMRPQSDQQA